MTRINFNGFRNSATTRELLAGGKGIRNIPTNVRGDVNALVFAAVLIVCSVAVGCSQEKPKPTTSNNEIPAPQVQSPALPAATAAPVMQAENKPAPRKVVHKKPATVNYTDKNYGVTFEYSRRYAIDTGDAALDVVMSNPVPMNFVQPGGIALAAVELPETGFANTDFSSAFFDVSVNKSLSADQCNQFAVPAPKMVAAATPAESVSQPAGTAPTTDSAAVVAQPASTTAAQNTDQSNSNATAASATAAAWDLKSDAKTSEAKKNDSAQTDSASKLMLGNLELRATEAVTGEGTRQSDAKYFHIYQNAACYEFALNVTTVASDDGLMKHVDRDKVFDRLEKILATVKIDEVKPAPDANAVNSTTPTAAVSPAK
jgi:hypothetical protein